MPALDALARPLLPVSESVNNKGGHTPQTHLHLRFFVSFCSSFCTPSILYRLHGLWRKESLRHTLGLVSTYRIDGTPRHTSSMGLGILITSSVARCACTARGAHAAQRAGARPQFWHLFVLLAAVAGLSLGVSLHPVWAVFNRIWMYQSQTRPVWDCHAAPLTLLFNHGRIGSPMAVPDRSSTSAGILYKCLEVYTC